VIQIHLPPLRARREDVPLLADHFLRKHAASAGRALAGIDPDALAALCDYDFPGNVRELENLIERAVTLESADRLKRGSFPDLKPRALTQPSSADLPPDGLDLERVLADFERNILLKALDRSKGVRKEAARLLGITFRSFRYRLAKLGVASEPTSDDNDEDTDVQ
jgi:two-component system response regulator PilR (NtrC family)